MIAQVRNRFSRGASIGVSTDVTGHRGQVQPTSLSRRTIVALEVEAEDPELIAGPEMRQRRSGNLGCAGYGPASRSRGSHQIEQGRDDNST